VLPGTYDVTVTDATGCEKTILITVTSPLGINELVQSGLTVYPNPMSDFVNIESSEYTIETAQLIDNSGRLVLETQINSKIGTIETSQLAKGNYLLILKTADHFFQVHVIK
jgi:hypothetical protein